MVGGVLLHMVGQEGFEPSPIDYESIALDQLSYSPIFSFTFRE